MIVLHKPFVGVFFKQKSSDFLLRNNSILKTVLSCYTLSLVNVYYHAINTLFVLMSACSMNTFLFEN